MELEVEGLTGAACGEKSPDLLVQWLPRAGLGDPRRHGGAAHHKLRPTYFPRLPGAAPDCREGADRGGGGGLSAWRFDTSGRRLGQSQGDERPLQEPGQPTVRRDRREGELSWAARSGATGREAKTWHGQRAPFAAGLSTWIQAYLTAAAINLKRLAAARLALLLRCIAPWRMCGRSFTPVHSCATSWRMPADSAGASSRLPHRCLRTTPKWPGLMKHKVDTQLQNRAGSPPIPVLTDGGRCNQ